MNYQDRVQKKAEEFARVKYDRTFEGRTPFDDLDQASKACYVEMWDTLPLAEKAVRDEASAYEGGVIFGTTRVMLSMDDIRERINELGYLKTEEYGTF